MSMECVQTTATGRAAPRPGASASRAAIAVHRRSFASSTEDVPADPPAGGDSPEESTEVQERDEEKPPPPIRG